MSHRASTRSVVSEELITISGSHQTLDEPAHSTTQLSETALAQLEDIFFRETENGWAKSLEIRFDVGDE